MSLNKKFFARVLIVAVLISGWLCLLLPKNVIEAETVGNEQLADQVARLQQDVWTLERNVAFANTDINTLLPYLDQATGVSTATAPTVMASEETVPTNNWLGNLGEQIWLPLQAIFFDEQTGILHWRLPQIFSERVEFSEEVELAGGAKMAHLKVNPTSSGQIIIPVGDTWRYHSFGRQFDQPPLVLLTPMSVSETASFQLTSVTTTGFQVQLNQVATSSTTFNWLALESSN